MTTNIGYDVSVSCNEQLVAGLASDPGGYAGVLFQNQLISKETNQKIVQLDKTNTDKARMIVVELQERIKSFQGTYDEFITILRERNERHDDELLSVLTDKYKELEAVTDRYQTVGEAGIYVYVCVIHAVAVTSSLCYKMCMRIPVSQKHTIIILYCNCMQKLKFQ